MFSEKTVLKNPFKQFAAWYREHLAEATGIPEVVYLGTSGPGGKVSVRTVLLKDHDESGFTFFTNYNSKKGRQINSNKNVALLFYWPEKNRQVRVEGIAEKVAADVSDEYFATRPRESQLAAWTSEQSTEIPGREHLEERFMKYRKEFEGVPVRRPEHWGGYRLVPDWFEFWVDRPNRLHDRITYTLKEGKWIISRLAP